MRRSRAGMPAAGRKQWCWRRRRWSWVNFFRKCRCICSERKWPLHWRSEAVAARNERKEGWVVEEDSFRSKGVGLRLQRGILITEAIYFKGCLHGTNHVTRECDGEG